MTDTKTHRGHVIGPFTMSSLQSLHSVKVTDDPDHITHPEAVVLDDREAGKSLQPAVSTQGCEGGHMLLHEARRANLGPSSCLRYKQMVWSRASSD